LLDGAACVEMLTSNLKANLFVIVTGCFAGAAGNGGGFEGEGEDVDVEKL
jgi:hypothetical protein